MCHMPESREELATRKLQGFPPGFGFHFDTGLESEDAWLPGQPKEVVCRCLAFSAWLRVCVIQQPLW